MSYRSAIIENDWRQSAQTALVESKKIQCTIRDTFREDRPRVIREPNTLRPRSDACFGKRLQACAIDPEHLEQAVRRVVRVGARNRAHVLDRGSGELAIV
jgi:hypothetical protein